MKQNVEKINKQKDKSYNHSIKDCLKYLKIQETIWFFLVVAVVINFVYNPLMFVVLPYVLNNVIKVSAFQLSLTRATIGAGAIVGAIVVSIQKSNNTVMKQFFLLPQLQAVLMIFWIFPNLPWFIYTSRNVYIWAAA